MRETRLGGRQTFAEFMMRRFDPAMRTVEATKARLDAMAHRAERAANLLRTQVDVERSAQNQALLASMDKRADLQLRLQRTVEGLSVVAISYYAVSILGYLLAPAFPAIGISKGWGMASLTVIVLALVLADGATHPPLGRMTASLAKPPPGKHIRLRDTAAHRNFAFPNGYFLS